MDSERTQGKARDTKGKPENKGAQGNVGKRKGNQAQPEKAMDSERTQGKARDTKGKPESKGAQGNVGKRKGNQA